MRIKQSRSQQEERKDWGSFLPSFDKVKYHGPERPFRAVELYTLLAGDVREQTLSPTIYLKVCHGPEQTFWVVTNTSQWTNVIRIHPPIEVIFQVEPRLD